MKILRGVLLVVVVAPALVVVGATKALACSCIPPERDRVAIEDAAAVFTGTVSEIEPGVDIGFDRVTWTFAVDEVFKGDVPEDQDVTSQTQSAACGLAFDEGKRYIVFAYEQGGGLQTNSCMNTRPLPEGKELKLEPIATYDEIEGLGPEGTRDGDEATGWDPFVVGSLGVVAVAAIVTVGALVSGHRRKG